VTVNGCSTPATANTRWRPGTIDFAYKGPEINPNSNAATLLDSAAALQILFDWYHANVDENDFATNPYLLGADIPGATAQIKDSLNSTSADEITLGVTKRFGTRGLVRVDFVNRTFHDFYDLQRDLSTGQITTPNGTFDKGYYVNNDSSLERRYRAIQVQFSYRPWDALSIGGNYTYSNAYGNVDGENTVSGPITSGILTYPEYLRAAWYAPKGDLAIDQQHKARLWVVYDIFNTKHNSLSVSLLQSFFSGTPYGAIGTINLVSGGVPYVTNPGYKVPPTLQTYYFTNRDTFHTDDETRTDISFNYGFKVPALGAQIEFFVIPGVTNVFNEKAVELPNASVYTQLRQGPLQLQPVHNRADRVPPGQHRGSVHRFGRQLAEGADVRQRCCLPELSDRADVYPLRRRPVLVPLVLKKYQPRPQGRGFCFPP
jgi:hypothetical protein